MAGTVLMFDYDGVISDSLDVFFEEFSRACRELGYHKLNSKDELLKLFEGNAIAALIRRGFPLWRLRQLADSFAPRIEAANQRIAPFPGMPELLARAAQQHPTYVITSNSTPAVEAFLAHYQITNVRRVMGSDQEHSKVKKIRAVMKQHPNAQGLYIGDTKGDMLEARKAGAIAVAVGWGWHPVETLRTGKPHHVVHDQEELRALVARQPAGRPEAPPAPTKEA